MLLNEPDKKVAQKMIHKATHSKSTSYSASCAILLQPMERVINDKKGKQYRIKDIVKLSAGPRGKLIPSLYDMHKQSISTMPGKAKGTGVVRKKLVGLAQESKIEKFKRDLEQRED